MRSSAEMWDGWYCEGQPLQIDGQLKQVIASVDDALWKSSAMRPLKWGAVERGSGVVSRGGALEPRPPEIIGR